MIHTLKSFVAVAVVFSMLVGCSSTNTTEEPVDTSAADQAAAEQRAADEAARLAALEAQRLADEQAKYNNVDKVFYFDFDRATLNSQSRAALSIHAEILKNSGNSVRLDGHADERGSREYNIALGERRANAVRDFLVLQGVSSSNIETVSYGEERPAIVGNSESSWSQNRRVELK